MRQVRAKEVDSVRGIAILLMIVAHVIAFYGPQNFSWLRFAGDTLCFTTFLFLFGFGLYLSLLKKQRKTIVNSKIMKRFALLLCSYYLIVSLSLLGEPKSIIKTFHSLVFIYVPGLTEFVLPFVFYTLLLPIIFYFSKGFFKKSYFLVFLWLSVWGSVFYLLGTILYNFLNTTDMPMEVKSWLSILSGSSSIGRFPLFQYLFVVLYGIFYGFYWDKKIKGIAVRKKIKRVYFFLIVCIGSVLSSIIFFYGFRHLTHERFPPSILFLFVGVSACLGMLFLSRIFGLWKAEKLLTTLGKNSLGIFLFHVAIIKLLMYKTIIIIDNFMESLFMIIFFIFGYFLLLYFVTSIQRIYLRYLPQMK